MHSLLHEAQGGAMKLIFRATTKLNIAPPTDFILEESGPYLGFDTTRQSSRLSLHLGYRGCSEPTGEVQAKPYKAINNAASRHFFGILLFKISEWMFS